jgi:hypothetical protein
MYQPRRQGTDLEADANILSSRSRHAGSDLLRNRRPLEAPLSPTEIIDETCRRHLSRHIRAHVYSAYTLIRGARSVYVRDPIATDVPVPGTLAGLLARACLEAVFAD